MLTSWNIEIQHIVEYTCTPSPLYTTVCLLCQSNKIPTITIEESR